MLLPIQTDELFLDRMKSGRHLSRVGFSFPARLWHRAAEPSEDFIFDIFLNRMTEQSVQFCEELTPCMENINRRLNKDSDAQLAHVSPFQAIAQERCV